MTATWLDHEGRLSHVTSAPIPRPTRIANTIGRTASLRPLKSPTLIKFRGSSRTVRSGLLCCSASTQISFLRWFRISEKESRPRHHRIFQEYASVSWKSPATCLGIDLELETCSWSCKSCGVVKWMPSRLLPHFHARSCGPEKSRKLGMRASLAAQIRRFLFPVLG